MNTQRTGGQNPDSYFMRRALMLALKAKGKTSPNPMVGAVVVKGNRIIAEGWHERAGQDHAEIVALKKAGRRAKEAVLYTTLEPCYHYGRTPPCVEAICREGIQKVVIGMKDPNPMTNGKSILKLRRTGINVKVGVLQKECERLNEAFIKYIKFKMPFVVSKTAQTLDGKIAARTGHSQWITSQKTRDWTRKRRDEFDGILVGINTILNDDPHLNGWRKKRLKKIIVDSQLRIPQTANLFSRTSPRDCILAATSQASRLKIKLFEERGVQVLISPPRRGRVDLEWLFKELGKQKIMSILIEGGGRVISSALQAGLVDKMQFYVSPKIIGDARAVCSITGFNISNINKTFILKDLQVQRIGEDIFIEGYVHRNR